MSQITLEQRYEIASLIKVGVSKQEIALIIGCHKTTIYRELSRNQDKRSGIYPRWRRVALGDHARVNKSF